MRCAQCGNEMPQGSAFCSRCGTRINSPRPSAQREFALFTVFSSWWEFTRHIIFALILIGVGVFLLFFHQDWWRAVPFVWVGGFLMLVMVAVTRRRNSWSLTSERLIERRGLIATRERQMELADIRSAEIDRRVWQKMLGLGDVIVASAASSDFAIRLNSISDPAKIAETIRQARLKRLG
ncbi:MAG: PH domain-containing protein [Candidatus Binataceae bacterium]|nr:PH domain-containing protein [Candidatus Binataceae bacterium]